LLSKAYVEKAYVHRFRDGVNLELLRRLIFTARRIACKRESHGNSVCLSVCHIRDRRRYRRVDCVETDKQILLVSGMKAIIGQCYIMLWRASLSASLHNKGTSLVTFLNGLGRFRLFRHTAQVLSTQCKCHKLFITLSARLRLQQLTITVANKKLDYCRQTARLIHVFRIHFEYCRPLFTHSWYHYLVAHYHVFRHPVRPVGAVELALSVSWSDTIKGFSFVKLQVFTARRTAYSNDAVRSYMRVDERDSCATAPRWRYRL